VSISMIDRVRFSNGGTHRGGLQMTVGGPLRLDPNSHYENPVTIKFMIIQGPPRAPGQDNGHVPSEDKRVRGVANIDVDEHTDRWESTVDIDAAKFRAGEARGVAMAVMEKDGEYAYETLTWCDFVKLPDLVDGAESRLVVSANPRGAAVRRWETMALA
jgi:hypothetical protein